MRNSINTGSLLAVPEARLASAPAPPLICLPFAGAGPSFFKDWVPLAGSLELIIPQLPGREKLFLEEPYRDVTQAIAGILPEVLKQWETPFPARQAPMRYRAPMRKYVLRPRGLWRDLLNRWPNPIEATVRVGGEFNEWPRWPFQLANCVARAGRFLARTGESARTGGHRSEPPAVAGG